MLNEIFDHIPHFSLSKKNAVLDQNLSQIIKTSKRWHLNVANCYGGITESKTSPRHLNFLKQLKKTTEVLPLLRVLVLDVGLSGQPTSAPQYSNSSKYTTYAHNNQKFGHCRFFFFF